MHFFLGTFKLQKPKVSALNIYILRKSTPMKFLPPFFEIKMLWSGFSNSIQRPEKSAKFEFLMKTKVKLLKFDQIQNLPGVRGLNTLERQFHLEGVTKYNNFLQKVGFSIFFIRIKSATPVNFWHKIGELWRPNMKDTATLMTYRERNWLQWMRNYSLVMS